MRRDIIRAIAIVEGVGGEGLGVGGEEVLGVGPGREGYE